MPHLSQIVSIEKDVKEKAASGRAKAEGMFGKSGLYSGISRTYTPKNEEGEQLPPESTSVQVKIKQVLADVRSHMTTLFDTVAMKDYANCHAKADIVVDGVTLLSAVPATHILFLEKQLAELLAFVKRIPTLDASEVWRYDENQDCYATEPVETIRTKKIMQRLIASEATKEHPAQVHVYQEDVPDGRWKTIKFSGAIPTREVNDIIARIEKVQMAVKFAREEANRSEVKAQKTGEPLLKYIFG